jgi:hypothetical protein
VFLINILGNVVAKNEEENPNYFYDWGIVRFSSFSLSLPCPSLIIASIGGSGSRVNDVVRCKESVGHEPQKKAAASRFVISQLGC